jgi:hypothetical protein
MRILQREIEKKAPFTLERSDYQIHWNGLPAYVCTQCGEPAFEEKALLEVWEWKEKAFKEVENLELKQALKERLKSSVRTSQKFGFKVHKTAKK